MTKNTQKNFRFTQQTVSRLESLVELERMKLMKEHGFKEHELSFVNQTFIIETLITQRFLDLNLNFDKTDSL